MSDLGQKVRRLIEKGQTDPVEIACGLMVDYRKVEALVADIQAERRAEDAAAMPRSPFSRATKAGPDGPRDPWGCRFIHGDPRHDDWRFCQAEKVPGSSYCAEHHALCRTEPPKRPGAA